MATRCKETSQRNPIGGEDRAMVKSYPLCGDPECEENRPSSWPWPDELAARRARLRRELGDTEYERRGKMCEALWRRATVARLAQGRSVRQALMA